MNTKQIGNHAENLAVAYLQSLHYDVLDRNWKNRWCEIDIVALKNGTIYFVEVKYRNNSIFGDGLDAITKKKLQQINFAAEQWLYSKSWAGDCCILVVAISPAGIKLIEA